MEMFGQLDAGLLNNQKGKNNARNSCLDCIFALIGRFCGCRYIYSNNYALGGQMKVTLEFDNIEDAKRAIHAADAWIALSEISELLRSQRKHDVPMEQTLICIQEIVQDTMPLIYS